MCSKARRLPGVMGLMFLSAFAPTAIAQNITATIVGTVKDGSGGVMPGATVTVINEDTNVELRVEPDAAGDFVAPASAPASTRSRPRPRVSSRT